LISIRELFNKKYFINFSIILLTFSSKDFVKLLSFNHEMSKLLNKLFVDTIPSMLTCPFWRKRPTCAQVLDTRKDWTIDRRAVEEWKDFELFVAKLKQNENQFFFKYLTQKFNQ